MCVLTFSWGYCCSYDGCGCCMSSSNKEQNVALRFKNEISNFKLAEQRRDTEALRAESCAGCYSLRSSAGWELWMWLLKAFSSPLWSKEARRQKECAETHSAVIWCIVRVTLSNICLSFREQQWGWRGSFFLSDANGESSHRCQILTWSESDLCCLFHNPTDTSSVRMLSNNSPFISMRKKLEYLNLMKTRADYFSFSSFFVIRTVIKAHISPSHMIRHRSWWMNAGCVDKSAQDCQGGSDLKKILSTHADYRRGQKVWRGQMLEARGVLHSSILDVMAAWEMNCAELHVRRSVWRKKTK